MRIPIQILENGKGLQLPEYKTPGSAGMDLRAACNIIKMRHGQKTIVPCGFKLAIPEGYYARVVPRSGLAFKYGVTVLNSPGTIDSDYRDEVMIILFNHGDSEVEFKRGERIAQLIIERYERIEWDEVENINSDIDRGGGFGSTGNA